MRKQNGIRMVLDCRPTNQQHRSAPRSRLATPSAFGGLVLDPETTARLAPDGWEECAHLLEKKWAGLVDAFDPSEGMLNPSGGSVDLKDGFYQFAVESVASWLALGETIVASEHDVRSVYSDRSGLHKRLEPSERLHVVFAGLPMGWSWALAMCQSALEECCRRAQARVGLGRDLLGDRRPAPVLHRASAVTGPYVDNAKVVAGSPAAAAELLAATKSELAAASLVFPDEVCMPFLRGHGEGVRLQAARLAAAAAALLEAMVRPWRAPRASRR